MKVLIIDDSDLACMQMEQLLTSAGHEVLSTRSPIGVTRMILDEGVDVVVLDVNMPTMRGDQLMRLFRGNPKMRSLGVVLVSGMEAEALEQLAEDCQADASVTKIEVPDMLQYVVMRAWNRRHMGQPSGDGGGSPGALT